MPAVPQTMKKIECFVCPERLDELEEALWNRGVSGLTVTGVEGFGKQRVRAGPGLLAKLKVEIFVSDDQLQEIVETIQRVARTGKMWDGKILILPADEILRIRTGEQGNQAV